MKQTQSFPRWLIVLTIILVLLLASGAFAAVMIVHRINNDFSFASSASSTSSPQFTHTIRETNGTASAQLFSVVGSLLGFDSPHTYLLLFENNTELRPGGGFIGVYAVIHVNKGHFRIDKIDGTENLDNATSSNTLPMPPVPLKKYLGVSHWYFRDSNWSPDFPTTARQALTLFSLEHGTNAKNIDAVIAVTPTVLEDILHVTGPVIADGMTFTSANVTQQLEYQVEYGYHQQNIPFKDRKDLVRTLFTAIGNKLRVSVILHYQNFLKLLKKWAVQKQLMLYSTNSSLDSTFHKFQLDGTVVTSTEDYLLWVDANLGSLKTDHAINRTLSYSFTPTGTTYLARVTMTYHHTGTFDWRTTRYRDYVRVYVPDGSVFVTTTNNVAPVDTGTNLGKTWFGTFISVEPGTTKSLTFQYLLPQAIAHQIKHGLYTLIVQKELGTNGIGLTLNLDFGITLTGAAPPEKKNQWGDDRYVYQTNLNTDRDFHINF